MTQVVSSAPPPHTMVATGRKLVEEVQWDFQCVTFRALVRMTDITADRATGPQSRYSFS